MRDATRTVETETVYVRKFADKAAQLRDEPEAVVGVIVRTEDGVTVGTITSDDVRPGDPLFAEINRQAIAAEARAKGAAT